MQYNNNLLENYILNEIYNIQEKENCLVLDNILIEGKVWDLTKKVYDNIKSVFNKTDSVKVLRDQAKDYRKRGKTKRAKQLEDSADGLESGVFRNQSLALIAIASIMFINNFKNTNNIESSRVVLDKAVAASERKDPEKFNDLAKKYLFKPGINVETFEDEFDEAFEEEQITSEENPLVKIFSHVIENAEDEEDIEDESLEQNSQEDKVDKEIYKLLALDNFDGDINEWSEDFLSSPNKEIIKLLNTDLLNRDEQDAFAMLTQDDRKIEDFKFKVKQIISFLDKNNADPKVSEIIGALATGKARGYFDDNAARGSSRELSDIVSQVDSPSQSILADYVMELAPNMSIDDFNIQDSDEEYDAGQDYDSDEDYDSGEDESREIPDYYKYN